MHEAVRSLLERYKRPTFQKGDTICWIGDSITHVGLYHSYVYLFYATRFPKRELNMYNCGIAGENAYSALKRLDTDILVHKPTMAAIMMGMNDVGRDAYGKDNTDEKFMTRQKECLANYFANMTTLTDALTKAGCRIVFLTPSIYDQTVECATANNFGVNDALGKCGEHARKLAEQCKGSVVDFHGLMTKINAEGQRKDPEFTIVGPDRIHPGSAGHFIMAYAFLKAQHVPRYVSKIIIDAAGVKVLEKGNCAISALEATTNKAAFECLENALPFPIAGEEKGSLELVPFIEEMNQEILTIKSLAQGKYKLRIDGDVVGEYTGNELADGINLAVNTKTPQYKQAVKVAELNAKRHDLTSSRLRCLSMIWNYKLKPLGIAYDDFKGSEKILNAWHASLPDGDWTKSRIEDYLAFKPREKQIIKEIDAITAAMRMENKPRKHIFAVDKIQGFFSMDAGR